MSCKSRTALTVCRDRCKPSWAGYHRCYGEACVSMGTRVELNVGRLCMNNRPLIYQWTTQRESEDMVSNLLVLPSVIGRVVSTARLAEDQYCQG